MALILVLLMLLFSTGCSSGEDGGSSVGAPGPSPTFLSRTVPLADIVKVNVTRSLNQALPEILVTYQGGPDQGHLYLLKVIILRSDGMVIQRETRTQIEGRIIPSQTIAFSGTEGIDRVQVTALIDGKYYPVYDGSL